MAKAIENLFDFEKHNIRNYEKAGLHFIHLDDLLDYLKADKKQVKELIQDNFILKNSLYFNDDYKEGLYIEEKGLYIMIIESPLPEMLVYKMKCYELFDEKMKSSEFIRNEN